MFNQKAGANSPGPLLSYTTAWFHQKKYKHLKSQT